MFRLAGTVGNQCGFYDAHFVVRLRGMVWGGRAYDQYSKGDKAFNKNND